MDDNRPLMYVNPLFYENGMKRNLKGIKNVQTNYFRNYCHTITHCLF